MKKLFLFTFTAIFSVFLFTSCQTPTDTPNKVTIKQVKPDGTKEVVMELGDGKDDQKPGQQSSVVLPGVKGIAITAEGFSPAQIPPFPKGTKLMIQNIDEKDHWPIADDANGMCGDLDPGKALKPREIYEYHFDIAGECTFHDSLNADNPKFKTTLTITE